MGLVWWEHPVLQKAALFYENGTGGAADDPYASRNAPFINPAAHLDKIKYHSDLDYMEVSHGPTNVTISHASVAAGSGPGGEVGLNGVLQFPATVTNHDLLTHGLGYVPDFMVIYDGDVIYPGRPVQVLSDGRTRKVAANATSSVIRLREWAVRTSNSMAAASRTYTVIVFREPRAPSGIVLRHWDPVTGILTLARGRFRSDRRYLQVVPGGTPFGFAKGRTIDWDNGTIRYVDPDGSVFEIVPASFAMKVRMSSEPNDAPYGPSMAYAGSFAGSSSVLVKVP
ncbi:MAG: hypothetical protein KIT02_10270 [Devosia sp.]|uniref:hypothetical protein n=1 Tax=Devosia sp. TaxID=1871048 RepID=UPI0024C6A990|nr:hypothetical protein [Devosia sp.]UYN98351.1 MAG: hypothetical protein KIT02_10270 [Devosia sp.]